MNFAESDDETLENEKGNEDIDNEDTCKMSGLPQNKPLDFPKINLKTSLKQTLIILERVPGLLNE